jgi:coatomer subunit beta
MVIEMLRKLIKADASQKASLMPVIFVMSKSKSSSVLYECASSIVQLTTAPSAIKVAVQSFLTLLTDTNDNNVKVIVLDNLLDLRKKYSKILEDYMIDVLSIMRDDSAISHEVSQKVLELTTSLVSPRNVKEVILFLEKEIARACKMEDSVNTTNQYRYLLIKSISEITQQYPETTPAVLAPLIDNFLKFDGKSTFPSLETILFIREVIEVHPEHRSTIFTKICNVFGQIKAHLVIRVALWIIGEYAESLPEVTQAFNTVKKNVGSLPIYQEHEQPETKQESNQPKIITKTVILPDGSYGTQTIVLDDSSKSQHNQDECSYLHLRNALVTSEDDYLSSCLAVTLTKLTVKAKKNLSLTFKAMSIDSILIICAMLKERQHSVKEMLLQKRMHKTD